MRIYKEFLLTIIKDKKFLEIGVEQELILWRLLRGALCFGMDATEPILKTRKTLIIQ